MSRQGGGSNNGGSRGDRRGNNGNSEINSMSLTTTDTPNVPRRWFCRWIASRKTRQRANAASENESDASPSINELDASPSAVDESDASPSINELDASPSINELLKKVIVELVCPITHPLDPVMAEDGRAYERSEIEKHFETHRGELVSPLTRQPMGQRLVPSLQIKNLIKELIDAGATAGDLTDYWKEQEKEKKGVEELLAKAESGDTNAMTNLSWYYQVGVNGFKKDAKLAYKWAKKVHVAGSAVGTAMLGYDLMTGHGVTKNETQATFYLSLAAERGSDYAAYFLGHAFCKGRHGLLVDTKQAIILLEKSLSDGCLHKHMTEVSKTRAREMLQELVNATSEIV